MQENAKRSSTQSESQSSLALSATKLEALGRSRSHRQTIERQSIVFRIQHHPVVRTLFEISWRILFLCDQVFFFHSCFFPVFTKRNNSMYCVL